MPRSRDFARPKLGPEDSERLAELIAQFKQRRRELGLDRIMTTRELLAKYPEIAEGTMKAGEHAAVDRHVDAAKGEVKAG
jgi:hypothetical protein